MEKHKGKIYPLVFAVTAGVLAWGAWDNYRPQVIYASCSDIAEKTTNLQKTKDIVAVGEGEFEQNLSNCLHDAGYY